MNAPRTEGRDDHTNRNSAIRYEPNDDVESARTAAESIGRFLRHAMAVAASPVNSPLLFPFCCLPTLW